jgi:hypothetical protein
VRTARGFDQSELERFSLCDFGIPGTYSEPVKDVGHKDLETHVYRGEERKGRQGQQIEKARK